ncbi:unnamed protein product [Rotaria socialis]|uniref:Potassium channel domain-containing protein n=1 Tax=Rotaria socialis TaxID=392032 RepID=A0A817NZB9_9BILA|nr:unnamed protein product [Rotaria socialis]CAF3333607.1 unnamed protein product [Rotaria socialis]CAF4311122.1 unnamed protein product [Rotaria socialis]CAF4495908.1 unnamed protein product [Rotaria socialis]
MITSKSSHLLTVPNKLPFAPLKTRDDHDKIPLPIIYRLPSSILITTSQPDAIVSNCHDVHSWKKFRKNSWQLMVPRLWSHVGLFIIVLAYIVFGGLVFYFIESNYESTIVEQIKIKHLQGIHNIRQIANDEFNWVLNGSFELRYTLWRGMLSRLDGYDNVGWRVQVHIEKFDRLIENELARMQAEQENLLDKRDSGTDAAFNQKWAFSTAMLYSATIRHQIVQCQVPIKAILSVLILYIVVGAALFSNWEGWSYYDAAYFSFITFSTVGLGDLVPGKGTLTENKNGKSILCALYLLYGLVIMTMCFKLLQDDLFAIKRRILTRLGFDTYHHFHHCRQSFDDRRYVIPICETNI